MPISFSSFFLHFLGFLAVSTLVWSDTEPSKRGKPVFKFCLYFSFCFQTTCFCLVFCERDVMTHTFGKIRFISCLLITKVQWIKVVS